MKISFSRWAALSLLAAPLALLPAGCAVGPDGYGYDDDSVGVDYYDSSGADYGSWDPGYYVGPYRGGGDHGGGGGEHRGEAGEHHQGAPHAFRPAAPSRSVPSIPSQPRGGGGGGRRR